MIKLANRSRWRPVMFFLFVTTVLCGMLRAQAPPCRTTVEDETKVVDAVRQMFVAAANDDMALFHRVTATDFYAFDGGRRFNGDALMELILAAHKTGKRYVWMVTEPDAHLACNDAWIAYVNRGSLQDETGTKNLTWLESAFLHKEAGVWKIRFFHSTRVP